MWNEHTYGGLTDILYEDRDLLVCRKPPGVASETARLGQQDMMSLVRNYLSAESGEPYAALIHRLDQPVEGILVFGLNPKAAAALSGQTAQREMEKIYHAVAYLTEEPELPPSGTETVLTDKLCREGRTNTSHVARPGERGAKEARLSYRVEAALPIENLLPQSAVRPAEPGWIGLIRIRLDTGRHHQIRVQLSHAGLPIAGDDKYATDAARRRNRELQLKMTALCATGLSFRHPATGRRMVFTVRPSHKAFQIFPEFLKKQETYSIKKDPYYQ